MTQKRTIVLAVAQMGPVYPRDSRESVVRRLLAMMREAKAPAHGHAPAGAASNAHI